MNIESRHKVEEAHTIGPKSFIQGILVFLVVFFQVLSSFQIPFLYHGALREETFQTLARK